MHKIKFLSAKTARFNLSVVVFNIFILLFFILVFSSFVYAQSLENDLYKISFDKNSGFFNIFVKSKNSYLLFPSKPLTSTIYLKYDSNIISCAGISAKIREVKLENSGIVFTFDLGYLILVERVSFLPIDEKNIGINVDFELTNKDVRGHYMNLGVVLDTYLGENSFLPFRVSNIGLIDKAKQYDKSNIPDIVYSLDDPKDPQFGLVFYFRKTGYSLPEKLYLASYDTMKDILFTGSSGINLTFDSKYKKGDAAVGFTYSEKFVEKNQSLKFNLLLGIYPLIQTETGEQEIQEDQNIETQSDYIKKYTQEQIEKLNKELEQLRDKITQISQSINDIEILDSVIDMLNSVMDEILELEKTLENYTYEEIMAKITEINNKLEEIKAYLEGL